MSITPICTDTKAHSENVVEDNHKEILAAAVVHKALQEAMYVPRGTGGKEQDKHAFKPRQSYITKLLPFLEIQKGHRGCRTQREFLTNVCLAAYPLMYSTLEASYEEFHLWNLFHPADSWAEH